MPLRFWATTGGGSIAGELPAYFVIAELASLWSALVVNSATMMEMIYRAIQHRESSERQRKYTVGRVNALRCSHDLRSAD